MQFEHLQIFLLLYVIPFYFFLFSSSINQSADSGGTDNFVLISQLKEEVMSGKKSLPYNSIRIGLEGRSQHVEASKCGTLLAPPPII